MPRIIIALLATISLIPCAGQTGFSLMQPKHTPWQVPTHQPVPWGLPLDGGSIRVLMVAPAYTHQDVDELSKRVDVEIDWAPVWSNTASAPDDETAQTLNARLDESLDDNPDVIVIGNLDWAALPQSWTTRVLAEAREGTGLLLSQVRGLPQELLDSVRPLPDEPAAALTRGLAASVTPEWGAGLEFLLAGALGEGRVVEFRYAESASFHFALPVLEDAFLAEEAYWDSYLSLVARAVRWLARREPEAMIIGVESTALGGPPEDEIPPGLPAEYVQAMKDSVVQPLLHPFVLRLSAPAPRQYDVRVQIRVPGRDLQMAWPLNAALGKGETTYAFSIPVSVGRCILDVWLYDRAREPRVVDWYSGALTIQGWPQIAEFRCSKPAINASDSVDVRVSVPAQLRRMEEVSLNGEVVVRATDNLGRVVAEKRDGLTGEGGEYTFSMDFVELAGNRLKVEVFASDHVGASLVGASLHNTAYDYTYITVTPRASRTFGFIAEGPVAVEYNMQPVLRALRELGIDHVAGDASAQAAFMATQDNARALPVLDVLRRDDGSRACPNDPAHWQRMMATLSEIAVPYVGIGVSTFFVNAIAAGHERETCATCIEALREFLRGSYDDVGALNAAWGTQFPDWGAVTFPEGAGTAESWAPYVDVQRFAERSLANACILSQAALQANAPAARAGAVLRGADAGGPVRDIRFFASQLNALTAPNDAVTMEKLRSYRIPGSFAAAACDAQGTDAYGRWLPWTTVAHTMSGLWMTNVYTDSARAYAHPAMDPSWKASSSLVEASNQMRIVKRGLARVLADSTRDDYGIAMYDSPASGDVNAASPAWYADRRDAEAVWMKMVEGLGYQFDFVSGSGVAEGALAEYRVLLMPAVWSMSDVEIDVVKAFAQSGGVIIADGLPGLYDEHGRRRDGAPLAEVFGVASDGAPNYQEMTEVGARMAIGDVISEATLHTVSIDAAVHASDGGESPVWETRADPGRTLLLNHRVDSGTWVASARAIGAVLGAEGFIPIASIAMKNDRLFDGEVVSWTYGAGRVIAFVRDPEAKEREKVKASLHVEGHVYDLSTGGEVRKPGKLEIALAPGEAAVFGVTPYAVTRLVVQPAEEELLPGRVLRGAIAIKTKDELPGKHLVWVELLDSVGEPLPQYSQGVLCAGGIGQVNMPLALNESLGFHTLRARDVLTGVEAEAGVEIVLPIAAAGPR